MKLKRFKQMTKFMVKQSNKALAKFITQEWPQAIKEREPWATMLLTVSAVDAVEILRHLTLFSPGGVLMHTAAFGVAKTMAIGFVNRKKIAAVGKFAVEHQAVTKFVASHSLQILRIWGNSDTDKEAFWDALKWLWANMINGHAAKVFFTELDKIADIPAASFKTDAKANERFTVDNCRVVAFPFLFNALAFTIPTMAADLGWLISKLPPQMCGRLAKWREVFANAAEEARSKKIGFIAVDPIIWWGYEKGYQWAKAVVDHEVGHSKDFYTGVGRAAVIGRFFAKTPKQHKMLALLSEFRASWYALEKDPDPKRIITLGLAILTYAMSDFAVETQKEENV